MSVFKFHHNKDYISITLESLMSQSAEVANRPTSKEYSEKTQRAIVTLMRKGLEMILASHPENPWLIVSTDVPAPIFKGTNAEFYRRSGEYFGTVRYVGRMNEKDFSLYFFKFDKGEFYNPSNIPCISTLKGILNLASTSDGNEGITERLYDGSPIESGIAVPVRRKRRRKWELHGDLSEKPSKNYKKRRTIKNVPLPSTKDIDTEMDIMSEEESEGRDYRKEVEAEYVERSQSMPKPILVLANGKPMKKARKIGETVTDLDIDNILRNFKERQHH